MKTMIESCHTKVLTGVRHLMLYCLMPLCAWAANRTVTIEAPVSVQTGQSFVVPNYASTDAGDGEQVGFFHAQYSTDGGANWTWFAGDVDAGTFVTRHAYITAGAAGSTIIVRTRIAFRGGYAGDVDFDGNGIEWGGSWDNWGSPPTRYAYISVVAPANRTLTINAPASVDVGQSFSVSSFASTDATDGEQLGFFHGQYSTDSGASWTWFAGDVNAGGALTRTANITAGPGGSTIIVRVRIAYRGGGAGDVDYNGSGIDWGGSWDSWSEAPAKSATITVTGPGPGSLMGMGSNYVGELGDGTTTNRLTPVLVATDISTFAAGGHHSLFVKTDGTLWATGWNEWWGQLGDGTTISRSSPVQVATGVSSVVAGSQYSLFRTADGNAWGMGTSSYGQLGNGSINARFSPYPVSASNVGLLFAGFNTSGFVKPNGVLYCMGQDLSLFTVPFTNGTSAIVISTPREIASGVLTASSGTLNMFYVKTNGTLWGRGYNGNGQLGDGTTTDRSSFVQVASGVSTVSCGSTHTLFLKTDGTLWAMGSNGSGQLGDGTTTDRHSPVFVVSGVSKIAAGGGHSLFLKTDGTLWAMGANGYGQLGDGTTTNRSSPVQVASGVVAIAAGAEHSFFRY